jgi:hypothetical protein
MPYGGYSDILTWGGENSISHILNGMEAANREKIRRFVLCFLWYADKIAKNLREQVDGRAPVALRDQL